MKRLRAWLARWLPDRSKGVGFSVGEISCGEVELKLDVEGRVGSVYLSKAMWYAIAADAGWMTEAEAEEVVWWETARPAKLTDSRLAESGSWVVEVTV